MPNPIKAVKAVKKITAGKAKVDKKVRILDETAEHRTYGNLRYVYKKGKMTEVFGNHSPIKVKPRNIGKLTKQMAPNKKQTEKIIRKVTPKKPGIPVKRRSK